MKEMLILKIGGSVLTHKSRSSMVIRVKLLREIALEIKSFLKKHASTQLLIVHGAGQAGHSVAKKYALGSGVYNNKNKIVGARVCNKAIDGLHSTFLRIFNLAGIKLRSINPAKNIIQKNGKIDSFKFQEIEGAFEKGEVPVLFGYMVPDLMQNFSICSGDLQAVYLAGKCKAKKLLFATDVDGIFNADPYRNKNTKLFDRIVLADKKLNQKIILSDSHSADVTHGLQGKVESFAGLLESGEVGEVVIFNGLKKERYSKALWGQKVVATKVVWRNAS